MNCPFIKKELVTLLTAAGIWRRMLRGGKLEYGVKTVFWTLFIWLSSFGIMYEILKA